MFRGASAHVVVNGCYLKNATPTLEHGVRAPWCADNRQRGPQMKLHGANAALALQIRERMSCAHQAVCGMKGNLPPGKAALGHEVRPSKCN